MTDAGQRIKEKREELHLTQDELAKRMGFKHKSSVSKVEKSNEITISNAKKFSKALNTTPEYICGFNNNWILIEDQIPDEFPFLACEIHNSKAFIANSLAMFETKGGEKAYFDGHDLTDLIENLNQIEDINLDESVYANRIYAWMPLPENPFYKLKEHRDAI